MAIALEVTKNLFEVPEEFSLNGLTVDDLELIQEGLIELKNNRLTDANRFKSERQKCVDLYYVIDNELVKVKSQKP